MYPCPFPRVCQHRTTAAPIVFAFCAMLVHRSTRPRMMAQPQCSWRALGGTSLASWYFLRLEPLDRQPSESTFKVSPKLLRKPTPRCTTLDALKKPEVGAPSCRTAIVSAMGIAMNRGYTELYAWLLESHSWTPLHHLEVLTTEHVVALLRSGASVHAGTPSPLQRAQLRSDCKASALLKWAAGKWSPQTHHTFPREARARATELLRLGYLLAWSPGYEREAISLLDVWVAFVLPLVVMRCAVTEYRRPGESARSRGLSKDHTRKVECRRGAATAA